MKRLWLFLRLSYHNTAFVIGLMAVVFGVCSIFFAANIASVVFAAVLVVGGFLTLLTTDFGRSSLKAYDDLIKKIVEKESDFRLRMIGYNPYCVVVGFRLAIDDAVRQKLLAERPMIKGMIW